MSPLSVWVSAPPPVCQADTSVQFAAVGSAVYQDAMAKGLGREIPTEWFLESVHP